MSVHPEGMGQVALVAADLHVRERVLPVLSRCGIQPAVYQGAGEVRSAVPNLVALLWASPFELPQGDNILPERGEPSDLLDFARQKNPSLQVILLLDEPVPLARLCALVARHVAAIVDLRERDFAGRLEEKLRAVVEYHGLLRSRMAAQEAGAADQHGLVGQSAALQRVIGQARRAALVSDAPVLIAGESGTGKQRLAELIHHLDPKRRGHPFVCVNCAAIAGSLAESELFGHRRGAFTGATEDRQGYFRAAHGGTILLDEVSELPLTLQPKILRVLQEGLVLPVGCDREQEIDVRVLAATNRAMLPLVEAGAFRLDLYQRLNVIELVVPPLRERWEDLPELFTVFLTRYAHYYRQPIEGVEAGVYEVLRCAIGSGNIRELENIARRILAFKESGRSIELTDLPAELLARAAGQGQGPLEKNVPGQVIDGLLHGSQRLNDALEEYEAVILRRLIERGLSQTALANRLGITRRTLYSKLLKYHLSVEKRV